MTQRQGSTTDESTTDWKTEAEQGRVRLAKLWSAFQSAEARIAELEAEIAARDSEDVKEVQPAARYPIATYTVDAIPGVGPVNTGKLRDVGVNLTDTLLHADIEAIAAATDLQLKRVQRWRDIAELMALKGVGPRIAEHLVDAGVTGIQQLAKLDADEILDVITKQIASNGRASEDADVLRRTLPSRCKRIAETAREAAKDL